MSFFLLYFINFIYYLCIHVYAFILFDYMYFMLSVTALQFVDMSQHVELMGLYFA